MDKRSLFYWSREFVKSLDAGQDYKELPRVITINILNFEFLSDGNFHSCFHLREDKDRILLTDALEIHYIDMVKWRKLSDIDIDLDHNPLHRWLIWLNPNSPPELVEEAVNMDDAILKAKEKQDYILSDEEALRNYEMRQLGHWDYINSLEYARDEGIEQGTNEGMKRGKAEIARKLKARGRPIDEIAEDTGLPLKDIERL